MTIFAFEVGGNVHCWIHNCFATQMIIIMKSKASDIVLPNVLIGVGETVREEEEAG